MVAACCHLPQVGRRALSFERVSSGVGKSRLPKRTDVADADLCLQTLKARQASFQHPSKLERIQFRGGLLLTRSRESKRGRKVDQIPMTYLIPMRIPGSRASSSICAHMSHAFCGSVTADLQGLSLTLQLVAWWAEHWGQPKFA